MKLNREIARYENEIKLNMNRYNNIGEMIKVLYGYENYVIFHDNNLFLIMEYKIDIIQNGYYSSIGKLITPYIFGIYEIDNFQIELLEYIHADNLKDLKNKSELYDEIIDEMIYDSDLNDFKGDINE